MNATILVLGFLFGAILQSANLNRYNVISGMATLENLAVAKAIAVAIGVGAIIIAIEIGFGFVRMAGGCTSGHILSGGMQLSLSSLVFAIFVFAGLLMTGKYFYKQKS